MRDGRIGEGWVRDGRVTAAALPVRDGLNPTRVRLPSDDTLTVQRYLCKRFPAAATGIRARIAAGEVVDQHGVPVTGDTTCAQAGWAWYYRDPPTEVLVPFEMPVLYRDDNLLVVDKPHFLATTPRGGHIVQTAVVRLRREFDLPELSPAHRLDRLTAGVLVCTVRRDVRGAYQRLFADRAVTKTYEAIAAFRPGLQFPVQVRNRIEKPRDSLRAIVVDGPPNAETTIQLAEVLGPLARYHLTPHTGKIHQLRVHMAGLGLPIVNDNFYPELYDVAPGDFTRPLQLLARSVTFTDPFTGHSHHFVSRRHLRPPSTAG